MADRIQPLRVQLLYQGQPLPEARVSFIPRGVTLDEGIDPDCVDAVNQAQIKLRVQEAGDGIDIILRLGPARSEPLAAELRSNSLALVWDMGETREDRIREFLEENDRVVIGLREGAWLRIEGESGRVGGGAAARIFRRGQAPEERAPGAVIDDLLRTARATGVSFGD